MVSVLNFIQSTIKKFGLNHIITENSNNIIIEVSGKRSNLVNFYSYIKNKLPFPVKVILCKHNLRIEIPRWYLNKISAFHVSSSTNQSIYKLTKVIPKFKLFTSLISKFIIDYYHDNYEEYFKVDLKGLMNYIVNNTNYNINIKDIVYLLRELSNLSRIKKVKYRYNRRYLEVLFIS